MEYSANVMKSLTPKLSFSALSRVALCVGALACSLSSSEAVIVVDGTTTEYRDNQNGFDAYYFLYDINKSSADFEATAFLTTDASGNSVDITAYNDGKTTANSDNPDASVHTSLTLAQAGKLTYDDGDGEDDYVAFYLSANQQGSSTDNFYGIDKLEIYTSSSATVDSIADARTGTIAYSFDSTRADTGGGTGQLELFYGNGNSNWDVVLYVPLDSFTLVNNDYQQTYVHFIVDTYTDTAGSDSWIYDSNNDSLVPEPSSALLIALGGLVSLFKRRR